MLTGTDPTTTSGVTPHGALLEGRLTRRGMTLLVLVILMLLPLQALSQPPTSVLVTLPLRVAVLSGLVVGLSLRRLTPIGAGRWLLGVGVLSAVTRLVLATDSHLDRRMLEVVSYGVVLAVIALLVAPKQQRRLWLAGTVGLIAVSSAVSLLPVDPIRWFQTLAILLLHAFLLRLLDDHANRAEAESELASVDPLTGLVNRRPMQHRLVKSLESLESGGEPISVLLIDLDHFKRLNDSQGHEAGDDALRRVGTVLAGAVRHRDVVCRWGGEEFLVLLPGLDLPAASAVGERLRVGIEGLGLITASVGVTAAVPDDTVNTLVNRADVALYQAKREGRNRVRVSDPSSAA